MTNRYELIDFTWWLCLSVSRLWAEHIDEILKKDTAKRKYPVS